MSISKSQMSDDDDEKIKYVKSMAGLPKKLKPSSFWSHTCVCVVLHMKCGVSRDNKENWKKKTKKKSFSPFSRRLLHHRRCIERVNCPSTDHHGRAHQTPHSAA